MKIMELCLSPGRGGLELYMLRSVIALGKRHEVVAVVNRGPGLVREQLEALGRPYRMLKVLFPLLPLLAAWRLARWLDGEGIEAMHIHWRGELPLAALAKRFSRRKPRLLYTRQMKISHGKNDPYHNFLYGQVDAFLAITRGLQEELRARLSPALHDRIRLLYYGTEPPRLLTAAGKAQLRKAHGIGRGQTVIGMFGQVFEDKGQHLLVEALGRMRGEELRFHALIVGAAHEPSYPARLRARAAELGLGDDLEFVDFVQEPQALMQICDVVVLASRDETFGLVLIEAMSVGTAVIGSDAGGVPEIIDDGRTGLLFRTGDSDDLYAKLALLHGERKRAKALGRAGAQKAARTFSAAQHYAALEGYMAG